MKWLLGPAILLAAAPSLSFVEGASYVGLGYYSQNVLGQISQSADGSKGTLGETSYPLYFKYDYALTSEWFLAPQLSYTLVPRSSAGDTAKVTIAHLVFQVGQNFMNDGSSRFDWYVGPGYLRYDIKGAGGTTTMNNGTSTAVFAVPGDTNSVQKVTLDLGASYSLSCSGLFILQ